ncbi:hypothetical protein CBR_g16046 [Chara braunii]|uniref:PCI domain-containing protein n=1 Tax=Chara braunii TaxID=69332 RepID=A0A388JSY5_CHABU|nr:hypothetical protein CBR_g16046 [Chara braunii]|eukprot:GBG60924.1 hypothetical protein CBR_g16046 [Chara braunii]
MPGVEGRPRTIEELVATNSYNPMIVSDLEEYVMMEQFEPEKVNITIMSRILTKALMAMPSMDFSLCMYLIPEKLQIEEPFFTFTELSHLLETANFREFWAMAMRSRDLLEVVPGFEQAIQEYAIHVLSITCKRVPRHILAEAVNIDGPSLDKFLAMQCQKCGWEVETISEGRQMVVLPDNEDNNPSLRKVQSDSISLREVARLFPVMS